MYHQERVYESEMPVYGQHQQYYGPAARKIEFEPVSEEDIRRSYD